MKQRLKKLLLAFPGFEAFCRLLTGNHVRVVMYHRFSSQPVNDPRCVDAITLQSQARYLTNHHAIWSPDKQLATFGDGDRSIAGCPVVVTVDDGYHDFHDVAYPVFRESCIPAMLFVTTGFVDGTLWFWWDKLEYILNHAEQQKLVSNLADQSLEIDLTNPTTKKLTWHRIGDRCRFLPDEQKEQLLSALAAELGVDLPLNAPAHYGPVSWEQIREMKNYGIALGAHTVHHPILTRVPLAEAQVEIEQSRRKLAEVTGEAIRWFCYPQGGPADFNPELQLCIHRAGYAGSYIAYQDLEHPDDPYALSRYCISSNMMNFRWIMCGAEYLILQLRRLFRLSTAPGDYYWAGSETGELQEISQSTKYRYRG